MSVQGKWRIVETPDHDMVGPSAYILFGKTGGEFVFDCLTGSIHGACDGDTVEFSWTGNDDLLARVDPDSLKIVRPWIYAEAVWKQR